MRKLTNEELGRPDPETYKGMDKIPCVVVLDNIRSLNNIGSVFRTSDAFLVERICLCGITAKPPHRDIHKTALGATETVSWSHYSETLQAVNDLKKEGYKILSVEQVEGGIALQDLKIDKDEKIALVFGHEVKGVSQQVIDRSDGCLDIPQYGTKHSLNISVCAGIVIWEIFKKYAKIS